MKLADSESFHIELLASHHNRSAFDCGEPSLNQYLHRFARQNADKDYGRTYVAVADDPDHVLGYYTLSSGAVSFEALPMKAGLPRYPAPVIVLGRLAVDGTMQGQGIGEALLLDALDRASHVAEQIGIHAIEVNALNQGVKRFYAKHGFVELLDDPLHLYLPLKVLRKLTL